LLRKLQAQGISFEITSTSKLRILTRTTKKQFELIRLRKTEIMAALSPKYSNFGFPTYSVGCNKILKQANNRNYTENECVEAFNAKLDKVLSDEKLYEDCQTILDEQKAILVIDGRLSEDEAETQVTKLENIRRVVISV